VNEQVSLDNEKRGASTESDQESFKKTTNPTYNPTLETPWTATKLQHRASAHCQFTFVTILCRIFDFSIREEKNCYISFHHTAPVCLNADLELERSVISRNLGIFLFSPCTLFP
jgi:hypothetical protein